MFLVTVLATLALSVFIRSSEGYPQAPFSLESLLSSAEVIVKGRVLSVTSAGRRAYPAAGGPYQLPVFEADFRVELTLKGAPAAKTLRILFFSKGRAICPGSFDTITSGNDYVLFLKQGLEGTYQFATVRHGQIRALPGIPDVAPSDTPRAGLEKVLIHSLESADAVVLVPSIKGLGEIGGTRAREALEAFLKRLKPTERLFRGMALASLVRLGSKEAVRAGAFLVLTPDWSSETEFVKDEICSAIGDIADPDCAAVLLPSIAAEDARLRREAARALRGMHLQSNIPYLLSALDNADVEVRYQAMIGLAETLNRGGDWAPSFPAFARNPDLYISKWKNWWKEEGQRSYAKLSTLRHVSQAADSCWGGGYPRVGRYMCLNDDDDDGDGVVDYDDGYNKDGIDGNADDENPDEDDLVALTLRRVLPDCLTGTVTLSKADAGNRIKVWTSATKGEGNEVTLPATYDTPADLPRTLYVEGVATSDAPRDVELKLEYTEQDTTCSDRVRITVMDVELLVNNTFEQEDDYVVKENRLVRE